MNLVRRGKPQFILVFLLGSMMMAKSIAQTDPPPIEAPGKNETDAKGTGDKGGDKSFDEDGFSGQSDGLDTSDATAEKTGPKVTDEKGGDATFDEDGFDGEIDGLDVSSANTDVVSFAVQIASFAIATNFFGL